MPKNSIFKVCITSDPGGQIFRKKGTPYTLCIENALIVLALYVVCICSSLLSAQCSVLSAQCSVSTEHSPILALITCTTSVQFHLSMRIFSKGSHPVSFRSFSCRLWYIVHNDDGLRVLLSASVRGIIILPTKSYDAYIYTNLFITCLSRIYC